MSSIVNNLGSTPLCDNRRAEAALALSLSVDAKYTQSAMQELFKDVIYDPHALAWLDGERLSNVSLLLKNIRKFAFYDEGASIAEVILLYVKIHLCGLSILAPIDTKRMFWIQQYQAKTTLCGLNLLLLRPENLKNINKLKLVFSACSDSFKSIPQRPRARITKKSTASQKAASEQTVYRELALKDSLFVIDTVASLCTNTDAQNTLTFLASKICEVIPPEDHTPFDAEALHSYVKRLFKSLEEDLSPEQLDGLTVVRKGITDDYIKEIALIRLQISAVSTLFSKQSDLKTLQLISYKFSHSVECILIDSQGTNDRIIPEHYSIMAGHLGVVSTVQALKKALSLMRFNAYLVETPVGEFKKTMDEWWQKLAIIRACIAFSSRADFYVLMCNENEDLNITKPKNPLLDSVQKQFNDFNQNYQKDFDKVLCEIQGFNNPADVQPNDLLRTVKRSNALLMKSMEVLFPLTQLLISVLLEYDEENTSESEILQRNCSIVFYIYTFLDEAIIALDSQQIRNFLLKEEFGEDSEKIEPQPSKNQCKTGRKKSNLKHAKKKQKCKTNQNKRLEPIYSIVEPSPTDDLVESDQEEFKMFELMASALQQNISNPENLIAGLNVEVNSEDLSPSTLHTSFSENDHKAEKESKNTPSNEIHQKKVTGNKISEKMSKKLITSENILPREKKEKPEERECDGFFSGRSRKLRNFIAALSRLGFYPDRIKGDHQILKNQSGKILTVPLHRTVALGTAQQIIKQAKRQPL